MHAQVYQPAALITSSAADGAGKTDTSLPGSQDFRVFLAQLGQPPNPGELTPNPLPSFLSSRRSSGLALYLLILAGPRP